MGERLFKKHFTILLPKVIEIKKSYEICNSFNSGLGVIWVVEVVVLVIDLEKILKE